MIADRLRIEWPSEQSVLTLTAHNVGHTVDGSDLLVHLITGEDIRLRPGMVLEITL